MARGGATRFEPVNRQALVEDALEAFQRLGAGMAGASAAWGLSRLGRTVLLERDGNYPAFDGLLAQLAQARAALARGRAARWQTQAQAA
jgi:choline dehydrogenase-like flavoprotein